VAQGNPTDAGQGANNILAKYPSTRATPSIAEALLLPIEQGKS
jgi:hypothetical protein